MDTVPYLIDNRYATINLNSINFILFYFVGHGVRMIDVKITRYRHVRMTDGITYYVYIL